MRTVYPYGIFVKKSGDTMSGTLAVQVADKTQLELKRTADEGASLRSYGVYGRAILGANAYFDGVNFQRYNTSYRAIEVYSDPRGDILTVRQATAGSNPIAVWSTMFRLTTKGDLTIAGNLTALNKSLLVWSLIL